MEKAGEIGCCWDCQTKTELYHGCYPDSAQMKSYLCIPCIGKKDLVRAVEQGELDFASGTYYKLVDGDTVFAITSDDPWCAGYFRLSVLKKWLSKHENNSGL